MDLLCYCDQPLKMIIGIPLKNDKPHNLKPRANFYGNSVTLEPITLSIVKNGICSSLTNLFFIFIC